MFLDPILPKYSDFGRYSNKYSDHLDVIPISEMKHDCKILTEFFELEFFVSEIFVTFFIEKHQIFQFMRKTPAKKLAKTLNRVFC